MAKEYKNYSQKLLDPRWQKLRLLVLDRDKFTCQQCLASDKTLHVHHLDYEKGLEPWEYPDNCLITLCEDCHFEVKEWRPLIEERIINILRSRLKDRFLFHCFEEFLSTNMYVPEMTLLLWEADQGAVMEFLQDHVNERNKDGPELENKEDMERCNACGSRNLIDFKRYQYLRCAVCGYSINYGKNQDNQTETC